MARAIEDGGYVIVKDTGYGPEYYQSNGGRDCYNINRASVLTREEARTVVDTMADANHVSIGRVFVQQRTMVEEWKEKLSTIPMLPDMTRAESMANHLHRCLMDFPDNPFEGVQKVIPVGWSPR